jgi:hypothetical protein
MRAQSAINRTHRSNDRTHYKPASDHIQRAPRAAKTRSDAFGPSWSDSPLCPVTHSLLCHLRNSVRRTSGCVSRPASNQATPLVSASRRWPDIWSHYLRLITTALSLPYTIPQQKFLAERCELLVEGILSHWHACKFVPLFLNKNFLVSKGNCLLRVSTTTFTILSAISSPFSPPLQVC